MDGTGSWLSGGEGVVVGPAGVEEDEGGWDEGLRDAPASPVVAVDTMDSSGEDEDDDVEEGGDEEEEGVDEEEEEGPAVAGRDEEGGALLEEE